MNAMTPVLETHTFRDKDFVGGDVVLDFVNTVTGRNGRPRDWIPSFGALADWATAARLLSKGQCQRLKRRSRHVSKDAATALETARKLREVLYRVFMRSIAGDSGGKEDLRYLHQMWCQALGRHSLRSVRGSVQPVLLQSSADLEAIGSVLAVRAMDVLRDLPVTRLRQCSGPNCAWLFIDSSKGGRRRWCDMATCGNDAKGRRHYLSKKKSTPLHSTG
jgi:predicted RNA-binding Zn ribbon-like protein